MKALTATDFNFPGQKSVYHGKVRDVYNINGEKLVMVATDRISAFDVVLPKGIPFKGQMLNQIAAKFLDATTDICPNWKMATPDPMVTVGVMCEGFPVEMIVRGYLCGSAWRAYKSGVREICGVKLPEGMKENQKFPEPIIPDYESRNRRTRCRYLQRGDSCQRPGYSRRICNSGEIHNGPLQTRYGNRCRTRLDPCRYQI